MWVEKAEILKRIAGKKRFLTWAQNQIDFKMHGILFFQGYQKSTIDSYLYHPIRFVDDPDVFISKKHYDWKHYMVESHNC